MIIFLNKCDILQKKLEAGIRVCDHLPSYGERPNEGASVIKCALFLATDLFTVWVCTELRHVHIDLSKKFQDTLKENSPIPRICYLYPTSVTVSSFCLTVPPSKENHPFV
jgi:guanine nucleotide-binding protein alpha-1 subunit